jgi:hypothetical protein
MFQLRFDCALNVLRLRFGHAFVTFRFHGDCEAIALRLRSNCTLIARECASIAFLDINITPHHHHTDTRTQDHPVIKAIQDVFTFRNVPSSEITITECGVEMNQ